MMKISKPVLTNEFLFSSVQFTSLNSIVFKNVKNVYEGNEKIILEYEHSSKIEESSRDWIGIFPRGWSTLQQYITFEWVSQSFPSGNSEQNKENADLIRRAVNFCPKYHMGSVNSNSFYQFVYISKQIEVLGVSSYFRFDMTNTNGRALELECLVPVPSKLRSTSVSDFGILLGNNLTSSTSIGTRTLQTSSIHSLQNLDTEAKSWAKEPISLNAADVKKPAIFQRKTSGTSGDALDPYTSHSEPVFPMSFQMAHCKKCFHFKRGGEFLRSQQVLQSKVGPRSEETSEFGGQKRTLDHEKSDNKLKIVMERNKVLEERSQEMKKEMERLQAESKKLKMSFHNANKEKVAYEKFVKDFIKSLEKDSIVRVVNGNTEILVKKVNYVGMEEHPRGKKTSKRERELKAVIGLQEITIRNLINSLQEKAKSVKELNQTVKLAQAFSSARDASRDYGSDAEENADEVSNSEVTSEYEFSLTKPQPPEETTVEDTDAVLDDIRRTTEMELKDIGINRSLGKSTSRDSDLEMPSLSVLSYHNQGEGTRPKKPRLFDNLEDCWPLSENTTKTVQRRVIESSPRSQGEEDGKLVREQITSDEILNEESDELKPTEEEEEEEEEGMHEDNDNNSENNETSSNAEDPTNCEDYYDAYEDNEILPEKARETEEATALQGESEDEGKSEKKNFLVTAIIPQETHVKPVKAEDWMKVDQEGYEVEEKKPESPPKRGNKFTCELSIDFSAKRNQINPAPIQPSAIEDKEQSEGESQSRICEEFDMVPFDGETKREKSLVTFKKANKCLEIKITQLDQKNSAKKNFVHQKMIVKFEKDSQSARGTTAKSSKFEFNLALSGLEEGSKAIESERRKSEKDPLNLPEDETKSELEASPRTVWNDAADELMENESIPPPPEEVPKQQDDPQQSEGEREIVERQSVQSEEEEGSKAEEDGGEEEESFEGANNIKSYQDSLRYEKNMEFLQQKTHEKVQDDEEKLAKEKPSAILIQNGQTKLALIRYQ